MIVPLCSMCDRMSVSDRTSVCDRISVLTIHESRPSSTHLAPPHKRRFTIEEGQTNNQQDGSRRRPRQEGSRADERNSKEWKQGRKRATVFTSGVAAIRVRRTSRQTKKRKPMQMPQSRRGGRRRNRWWKKNSSRGRGRRESHRVFTCVQQVFRTMPDG